MVEDTTLPVVGSRKEDGTTMALATLLTHKTKRRYVHRRRVRSPEKTGHSLARELSPILRSVRTRSTHRDRIIGNAWHG